VIKFSSIIKGDEQIESILMEKGDDGKVDIEINGKHFRNTSNILNNSRNPIEIFLNPQKSEEKPESKSKLKRKELIKYPSVLIITPTKNDGRYLSKYLKAWNNVDYPRDKIRWVWICGKSNDDTMNILDRYFSKRKWNCEIYSESKFKNLIPNTALWIADVLNQFKSIYKGEEYVLISDTDLSYLPPNLLQELIGANKDVVAPYIWQEYDHNIFFDTYIFRYYGNKCFDANSPPFKNSSEPVKMESVGTIFLVKGEVFRKAKWENPAPHLQFCKNVRRLGYEVWALPYVGVRHAVCREAHPPVEDYKNIISKYLYKMRSTI